MPKRKETMVAIALGIVSLIVAITWTALRISRSGEAPRPGAGTAASGTVHMSMVDYSSAPVAVQQAAEQLRTSRVGYAISYGGRTYLVISTGGAEMVDLSRAEIQAATNPNLVQVNLNTRAGGRSLIIASTVATDRDFQFNLDGVAASIPTLVNRDRLPLIHLGDSDQFALVTPTADQMVFGSSVHVQGYARVLGGHFTVKVISPKGRVLGLSHVMAAAGAPSWASFTAEVSLNTADLPATGYVVLEESSTNRRMVVPVHFRTGRPEQLG